VGIFRTHHNKKHQTESTAMKKLILFVSTTFIALSMSAQTIVNGGQFKDRILPMQGSVTKSAEQAKTNSCIFSIHGQRLRTLQKGINIVNGRKVLVY